MAFENSFKYKVLTLVLISGLAFCGGKSHYQTSGSRQYNFTIINSYIFPDEIRETSGVLYDNGLVWTFNDSGGEPELYGYSTQIKTIIRRILLKGATNIDWEDITCDSSYIYVGDIGNNFGLRDSLTIYKINKRSFRQSKSQIENFSKITFTYPGYNINSITSFSYSSFDCEAMVWHNDSIFLFTKDWNNKTTTLYAIPDKTGRYTARKIVTFNCNGLITAADFNGKRLLLLGYKNNQPFIWTFTSKKVAMNPHVSHKLNLTAFTNKQTEGLAFLNDSTIFISSERSQGDAMLWQIILRK